MLDGAMNIPTPRRIVSERDPGFCALFEIYSEAIPAGESKSRDEIAAMICSPNYCVLVFESKGVVLGFTMTYAPQNETYALLEYMAVSRKLRSQGFGSSFFQLAISSEFLPPRHEVVIVEIDSPEESSARDVEFRLRRLEFYRRNGCVLVPRLNYLFPLVCETPAPEMKLLAHFRGKPRNVLKSEFRRWLQSIYTEVYAMDAKDSRIDEMLSPLSSLVLEAEKRTRSSVR
jgi:hypothetical protein